MFYIKYRYFFSHVWAKLLKLDYFNPEMCVSTCLQCSLACHKKCLETLAIQCGHKKLQGRLHLFGIDFTQQAANNSPDSIPFIVRKCTSEIESRALNMKVFSGNSVCINTFAWLSGRCPSACILCCQGIYRVNGAKSRVEKLCQAFENGKHLVELSELYPHDISNVLKLYLRQVGCQSNSFSWIFFL